MSVFSRLDRHAALTERMAGALGVDIAEETMSGNFTPNDYRNAVFACTGCTQPEACLDWLEANGDHADLAPDYCRNKERFERLAHG